MRKTGVVVAGAAALVAVAAVWSAGRGMLAEPPPHADPETVALGKAVYDRACASCHGAELAGEANWREPDAEGYLPAPPHDASGHTWHHPDPLLFAIVKHGSERVIGGGYRSRMPGFGDTLSDAEIAAVLAFIKSTWPPEIVAQHDEFTAEAAR